MDRASLVLLLMHLTATGLMVGVIWFVQVVHYPLFAAVPVDGFAAWERAHVSRTGMLVGPLMLVEAATCCLLLVRTPAGVPTWMPWTGVLLLAVLWASTFFIQVPMHRRLESGLDLDVVRRLVDTNWIRTVAWTLRGALAAWMLVAFASAASAAAGRPA